MWKGYKAHNFTIKSGMSKRYICLIKRHERLLLINCSLLGATTNSLLHARSARTVNLRPVLWARCVFYSSRTTNGIYFCRGLYIHSGELDTSSMSRGSIMCNLFGIEAETYDWNQKFGNTLVIFEQNKLIYTFSFSV